MFSTSQEVYEYLSSFINLERKLEAVEYRLDRMCYLRRLFAFPDEAFKTIHVTGSKGKGSTATLVSSILQSAGFKTGLFTSPHLLSFTERICVDSIPVADEVLLPCAETLRETIPERRPLPIKDFEYPTFFELLTILAFLCFKKAGCDYAVIEVGLGGRLDTTNVITPELCIITSIELEHTEILGTTIEQIAFEKAGIIKSLVPVVSSVQKPEAQSVIYKKAYESCAPLIETFRNCTDIHTCHNTQGLVISWSYGSGKHTVQTSLLNGSQVSNVLSAFYAGKKLGIPETIVMEGIAKTTLSARFQLIKGSPVLIIDGAHTEDSIAYTVAAYKDLFSTPCVLLFGTAKDKHSAKMLEKLSAISTTAIITKPGTFKESEPDRLCLEAEACGFACEKMEDTRKAFLRAREVAANAGLPLLVCGSFYLCAEVLALVSG